MSVQQTHWNGCYLTHGHHDCALAYVASLESQLSEAKAEITRLREQLENVLVSNSDKWKEIAELRQALAKATTKDVRTRAFAARAMDCDDDPEYPMSKAELRAALKGAASALRRIAIDTAIAKESP